MFFSLVFLLKVFYHSFFIIQRLYAPNLRHKTKFFEQKILFEILLKIVRKTFIKNSTKNIIKINLNFINKNVFYIKNTQKK